MNRLSSLKSKIRFRYNLILKDLYLRWNKKQLADLRPYIVSNNCWGGIVYQDLELPYLSPFVNMYMLIPCYLKLVKNLPVYLNQELRFTEVSKYPEVNEKREKHRYPIGVLGDIEIQFIHYTDEAYTLQKWKERLTRLDTSKLLFVMSERDGCTPELIKEFENLNHPNKVCFTNRKYDFKSTVFLKPFKDLPQLPGADEINGHTYWRLPLLKFLKTESPGN